MTTISLSHVHFPVHTLGPGNRLAVWFQGCSLHCPGCISPETWPFVASSLTVEEAVREMEPWLLQCDGVTISGGEPFDQPKALLMFAEMLRAFVSVDILVFTGYPFERVSAYIEKHAGVIDALVSDPYLRDAPQTMALRGSDNQRLHLLTALGHARFAPYDRPLSPNDKRLDLMIDERGERLWVAGIPKSEDLPRLRAILDTWGDRA